LIPLYADAKRGYIDNLPLLYEVERGEIRGEFI
jgi:hypothetical protein